MNRFLNPLYASDVTKVVGNCPVLLISFRLCLFSCLIPCLFLCLFPCVDANAKPKVADGRPGQVVKITFKDQRVETGKLIKKTKQDGLLETPTRKIYFNPNEISKIELDELDPPVIYEMNKPGNPRRQTLPAVVDNLQWGKYQKDFSIPFTCTIIPKASRANPTRSGTGKKVSDVKLIRTFTPTVINWDADKHHWPKSQPIGRMYSAFFKMLPAPKTFEEKLKRVNFYRQAKDWNWVRHIAKGMTPANDKEKALLDEALKRTDKAQAADQAMHQKIAAGLGPKPLEAAGVKAIHEPLKAWWHKGAPLTEVRKLEGKLSKAGKVEKAALLKAIQSIPAPPTQLQNRRIIKVPWRSKDGKARHYFVYLPSSYTPDKSYACFVLLHGQLSVAEGMIGRLMNHAERYQFILVAPEYIYGRRWGYQFSNEEHETILGAVRHAFKTLSIDPQRTYLKGNSQGGHANFDITMTYPNVFAGSIPIIGAPYYTDKYLVNQAHMPTYIIDGENDGGAPAFCRKGIQVLLKSGSQATYVEYINRGHDSFMEEYPAMLLWAASHPRQHWREKIEATYLTAAQRDVGWLRIKTGARSKDRLYRVRTGVPNNLVYKVKGTWSAQGIWITADKGLKGMSILVPKWYRGTGKKVRVSMNGRSQMINIKGWNLRDYFTEVAQSKDRWTHVHEVIDLTIR